MPHARRSDPETSHLAAESVRDLTERQEAVLELLEMAGAMTDEELVKHYAWRFTAYGYPAIPQQSESGLRTRRHELVEKGLVCDTGEKRRLRSGRLAVVWGLAGRGSGNGSVLRDAANAERPDSLFDHPAQSSTRSGITGNRL